MINDTAIIIKIFISLTMILLSAYLKDTKKNNNDIQNG